MDPLLHLAIIWAAVFGAVVAAKKTRLTPVLYFLFIGCVLANAGVLPLESGAFIRTFAELGIIFIMFALGFEESTDNFLASVRRSWGIALFGALGPFVVAYLIADSIWQDANVSLMVGLAMTATAVSLTMVSLQGLGLSKSIVATRIMTSALLDDIGSLVMVALVVPIATGAGELTMAGLALTAGKAVAFFLIVTFIGFWIFPKGPLEWAQKLPILRVLSMQNYLTFDNGKYATLAILLVALVVGLLAHMFGFHEAVGAYMAGLIVREEHFQLAAKEDAAGRSLTQGNVYKETKRIVDNAAFCWIGPVFFVDLGAKILFDWDLLREVMPYALAMTVGIFVIQIISAGLAARYTSGMNNAESLMIGLGMLGRAELAFVVMDIAYVQHSIMPVEAFFTLMITAFFLNVLVPVTISWWRPYYLKATSDLMR
ncbi:MAG: cation:proton antiporter [Gammaproteobacteria bacterium]|nr:cation:proton antiporter [Gammaproteobacteria bacterium]